MRHHAKWMSLETKITQATQFHPQNLMEIQFFNIFRNYLSLRRGASVRVWSWTTLLNEINKVWSVVTKLIRFYWNNFHFRRLTFFRERISAEGRDIVEIYKGLLLEFELPLLWMIFHYRWCFSTQRSMKLDLEIE